MAAIVALSTSAGGGRAKSGLTTVVGGFRVVGFVGFGENMGLGFGLRKWSGEDSEAEDAIFCPFFFGVLLSPTGERERGSVTVCPLGS
ncbi:hypothetical protein ACFX2K_015246 [Malus domestica]